MRYVREGSVPPALIRLYKQYLTEGYRSVGSAYWTVPSEWAAIAKHYVEVLGGGGLFDRTAELPGLRDAELGNAEKGMVCWRDVGFGVLSANADIVNSNQRQADLLRPALRYLGRCNMVVLNGLTRDERASLWWGAKIPMNRGKGAPTFEPRHEGAIALDYARRVWAGEASYDAGAVVDWLSRSGPFPTVAMTSFDRVQGSRKDEPNWVLDGQLVKQQGVRRGPKVRRITALPWVLNAIISPLTEVLKFAQRHRSGRTPLHLGSALRYLRMQTRKGRVLVASDLSKFDEHCSLELQYAWNEEVAAPVLAMALRDGLVTDAQHRLITSVLQLIPLMPMLSPSDNVDKPACAIDVVGNTRSGEKPTAVKGTDFDDARQVYRWWFKRRLRVDWVAQGDDLVLMCERGDEGAVRAVLEGEQEDGFEEKVDPTPAFLMRYLPQGFGILSRQVFSTINREPRFEPRSVFARALGLRARAEILKGHPKAHLFDEAVRTAPSDALRQAHALSSLDIRTLGALTAQSVGPDERSTLADDLVYTLGLDEEDALVSALSAGAGKASASAVLLGRESFNNLRWRNGHG